VAVNDLAAHEAVGHRDDAGDELDEAAGPVLLVIVVGLNALSARVYGEAEFWLAAIKVVIVIVFVLSGVFMIAGVMGENSPGLSNWMIGDAPFHNGFVGVIAVFMIAGFSFQGTELVGVAAGEAKDAEKILPKAINSMILRIFVFYVGSVMLLALVLPYTSYSQDPSPSVTFLSPLFR